MLKFKKGIFKGGNAQGIIFNGFGETSLKGIEENRLKENSWILVIPKNKSGINLFKVFDDGIKSIPMKYQKQDKYYSMFWESELTILFASAKLALEFMKTYSGPYKKEIKRCLLEITSGHAPEKLTNKYICLDNIYEDKDDDFIEDIQNLILTKKLSPNSFIATMKLFIIDWYRLENEREALS